MRTKKVIVEPYDHAWRGDFEAIRAELGDALGELALSIEHIGSTSVEGLAAKPIIDIDIVIEGDALGEVIARLAAIGYEHEGDLGIAGREAFKYDGKPHLRRHHLYVCAKNSAELYRHVIFRDYLRAHPDAAERYGSVKLDAARLYPDDIDGYIAHKSGVIEDIYRECGLTAGELYASLGERTPIEKGWSGDRKYRATGADGKPYLLRITPFDKAARRADIFRIQCEVAALGVPMCEPFEQGICGDGVYVIQRWIDGADAEDVLPTLPPDKQYEYGVESGKYLRRIHSIPAPDDVEPWEPRFNRKIDRKIQSYRDCPIKLDGGDAFLEYIAANRHLLKDRPQSFQHGDYHTGNMMFEDGRLVIIDFDRYDFGDPWEEFNRIVWCAQLAPAFARGMVDGYFDGDVPELFWRLLALYISNNTLSAVPWAIPFGQGEIDIMLAQARDVLGWYDGMTRIVPRWYA